MQPQSTTLYKTEGSSDKVYKLHLRQDGTGWLVAYENGRRGKNLKDGLRTKNGPIPYDEALALYTQILKGKLSDGYTPQEDGIAYAGTDRAGDVTGFQPVLLNPIEEDDLIALIDAGTHCLQIKHNGERRAAFVRPDERIYANRKGLRVGVIETIDTDLAQLAADLPKGCVLDGEDMGPTFIVFDVLEWDGQPLYDQPFRTRLDALHAFHAWTQKTASTALRASLPLDLGTGEDARAKLAALRAAAEEGVVARAFAGKAIAGRPSSGGDNRKHKFWKNATVRIKATHKTKSSISMEMLDPMTQAWVGVGNCTVPANATMPTVGSYLEVVYLEANKGGSLIQPRFDRTRTDVGDADTRLDQLAYAPD